MRPKFEYAAVTKTKAQLRKWTFYKDVKVLVLLFRPQLARMRKRLGFLNNKRDRAKVYA
jgi:hypothetical protein